MQFTDADGRQATAAQLKKQRRQARHAARTRGGIEVLTGGATSKVVLPNLGALQRKAERDMGLRIKLADENTAASHKAKRKLNDVWTNRNSTSVADAWDRTQKAGPCLQIQGE